MIKTVYRFYIDSK